MTETEQELQTEIEELRDKVSELQRRNDSLKEDIQDAWYKIEREKENVSELESELSAYEDQEPAPEFSIMVDQEKYDLFIEAISFFTLEQFEEFLKSTKYVKI